MDHLKICIHKLADGNAPPNTFEIVTKAHNALYDVLEKIQREWTTSPDPALRDDIEDTILGVMDILEPLHPITYS